jgi:aspartate/methionine/tyrosine aminotransferase
VLRGAFFVFLDFSRFEKSDEVLATQLLREARVATAPSLGFGRAGEGHLRISYYPDYEQVREGIERLRSHVGRRY